MAKQTINNGESGSVVRGKINDNFTEVYNAGPFLINTETDNYTLAIGDISPTTAKPVLNVMNAATAKTFTLPTSASVSTPTGTTVYFKRIGAGRLTIAGDTGVTVNSPVGVYTDPGLNVIFSCTYLGSDIWDLQNGVAVVVPVPNYYRTSGQYYQAAINGAPKTTQLQGADTIRARAFVVSVSTTFNSIKSDVSGAVALSKYRIGIYTDNGFGYPDQLIANTDTGEYDSATTGVKTGTTASNVTLAPGLYHIVHSCSHAITLRADNNYGVAPVYGFNPTNLINVYTELFKTSVTYGALPSTFPAGASYGSNSPVVTAINFI